MTEIRSLLLTDVVDSTRLSELLGDEAVAQLWADHDRVARDLLPRHAGIEIDKTDGMLLLFESVSDAVAYALDYHRALAEFPVRIGARAGLHVGPVILRKNSPTDVARGAKPIEVDGLAKPIAARVMSMAQGGQTLLTADAHQALGACRWQARSCGHWMMKGLSEPFELFEVSESNAHFPPCAESDKGYLVVRTSDGRWLPARQVPNNLSDATTSFLGRELELMEIKTLLSRTRLLTLLGMGGLGKTRLAIQIAREVLHSYADGVWFVDLAPISDSTLVVYETARVIGLEKERGRPLIDTLCAHLKLRTSLLILDNCEHLVEGVAVFADTILRAAPHVQILATSREALHVDGEQVYPMRPLPIPGVGDDVDGLARSAAVQLFVQRAQLQRASFALDERAASAIAELVIRLEGIPLALELAAARVGSLTVEDINARLKDRFRLLTGGTRVAHERHRTLRALVDWSYRLLNMEEQILFNRLGVFAGGFDLAAAELVCGTEPLPRDDVLDILRSLVEKSLVVYEQGYGQTRFKMLDTLRDYAREGLEQGGEGATTRALHCDHFFAFAKEASRGMRGRGQQAREWIARLETDLENVRTATDLSLSRPPVNDPMRAVKFAVAMMGYWIARGQATEGSKVLKAAMALPEVQRSDEAQSHALYVGAALADSQNNYAEALESLEACVLFRRKLGKQVDVAAGLSTLALVQLRAGNAAGAEAGEREALNIFMQLGDRFGEAIGLLHLGQIASHLGNEIQAVDHFDRCMHIAHEIENREIESECEIELGEIALERGDIDQAYRRFNRALILCTEAVDERGTAVARWCLGKVKLRKDEHDDAGVQLREALLTFQSLKMLSELFECLSDHAALALASGSFELALRLTAAIKLFRKRYGIQPTQRSRAGIERRLDALRECIADDAFSVAWEEGSGWEVNDAISAALSAEAGGRLE